MDSLLTVKSPKDRSINSLRIDLSKFPNLKNHWNAQDSREACRIIRKHKPALVILDVDLESGVGFEVFEMTRDLQYQKIIICNTPSYVIKAMRFNVDDYLVNPASSQEIEAAIEKLLFKKKKYKIQALFNAGRKPLVTLSTLFLETTEGRKAIRVQEIVRATTAKEGCKLHLANQGNFVCRYSLPALLDLLAGNQFWQVSEDEALNFCQIQRILTRRGKYRAYMSDGHATWLSHKLQEQWLQIREEDEDSVQPRLPLNDAQ